MAIGCANHKELIVNFDKKIVRMIDGEKAEYGFLFGNEKIVFIKSGAGGSVIARENKYLKMAHKLHERLGATVICSSNPDIESYLSGETLDEKAIHWVVKQKGFVNFEVYFIGNSDGAYKNFALAKKFPQTVKFLGINTSYIEVDELIDKLKDLSDIDKILVCGTKDTDTMSYVEPAKNAEIPNLKIQLVEDANHEFSNMIDRFIDLVDLI